MGPKIIKSLYGSITLLKAYCLDCRCYSFIINKKYTCCDRFYDKVPTKEIIKREIWTNRKRTWIPLKIKKKILEDQDYKCIYCGIDFNSYKLFYKLKSRQVKINFDHFASWIISGDNHEYNIFASCQDCNSIKSDKYFIDLISAREYILNRRKEKGIDK